MEDELNRLVEERHRLTDEIASLEAKFVSTTEVLERDDLTEQIDNCNQKKTYIQEQITDVQGQIVAVDENKVGFIGLRLNVQNRKRYGIETRVRKQGYYK